ncbi:nucleotide exchange factor GrpE [Sphingomonas solaris]|uniref:Protein GrpE n=1 Tax=Alterirhizorhabdus solaris TaxID=2529389 RepID=A0A558RD07_9SPHN|nr:nucleotide exchange factor GrpE [Sphingomonas solaris]TVV77248.1 nucleotide exchange factor GrpE [Sphingomonas solaris]
MNEDDTTNIDTNETAADAADENPFARLEGELERLKNEVLYAQAETQNVRRRLEKEKQDAQAYATTGFARDLLSVSDNLARALAAIPDSLREDEKMKPLVTGIEMTGKELETVFGRHGISKIEAMGAKLDPNRHQAIMEMEQDGAEPGTVVHEMQAGYMIKDRLLRPAMVGVAKAGAAGTKVDAQA